jgi:hypothetical protein
VVQSPKLSKRDQEDLDPKLGSFLARQEKGAKSSPVYWARSCPNRDRVGEQSLSLYMDCIVAKKANGSWHEELLRNTQFTGERVSVSSVREKERESL